MKATYDQFKNLGRLKRRSDFLRAQAGRKWVSPTLVLQITENGEEQARFGLTVTKKVSRSAVVRNRIRRRLRALAREILATQALPGRDYVLIGRVDTERCPYQKLEKDLVWCLKRLECLKRVA